MVRYMIDIDGIQINHHVPEDASCNHKSSTERKGHHSDKTKQNLISRLNRIEGQVRGVKGMIERMCIAMILKSELVSYQRTFHQNP